MTGFFYNPNIHPSQEYIRRREGAREVAEKMGIRVIFKDNEYAPQQWFRTICYREENRCMHCYAMRMERAFSIAKRGNFAFVTTTLLYSRKQNHESIRQLGIDMAGKGTTRFLYHDFRSGWQQGIEQSKAWNIYRQQYCGCLYSEQERFSKDMQKLT